MEGREHTGVILKLIMKGDEAWEEAWRSQPLPAGIHQAAAFRIAEGYDLGGATHFAIYETGSEDLPSAAQRLGEDEHTTRYTKFAHFGPVSADPTAGVVLVFTDCDDPDAEEAFNTWYTGHLHHTIENLDFHAASRYVSDVPARTPSKYLAIYESPSADTAQVQKDGVEWWIQGGFEGPKGMVLRSEIPGTRID